MSCRVAGCRDAVHDPLHNRQAQPAPGAPASPARDRSGDRHSRVDPVLHGVARRKNQHRDLVAAGTLAAQKLEAGQTWQAEVEDDGREGFGAHGRLGFAAVLHPIRCEPAPLQPGCKGFTKQWVVLDNNTRTGSASNASIGTGPYGMLNEYVPEARLTAG